jgi:hypothetical protein
MNTMQSHGTRVPDLIGALSEFDILTVQGYSNQWRGTGGLQPEKNLLSAVLLDAVECFQEYALSRDEYENRLFRETEIWIFEENWEWPFSFVNICQALAIDPQYFRKGLLRWKQNAMQSVSRRERDRRSA